MVKKLQGYAEKMAADLSADKPGPGARPPGRVKDPRPLLPEKKPDEK